MGLRAVLRLRCPRCLQGKVFRSLWRMHDTCPQCELKYAREDGYFFGAMYFSYALGILFALPTAIVMFLNEFHVNWIAAVLLVQLTGLSPIIFRYSRVIWMHFDHKFDPPKRDL